ncbi:MAG: GTP-dependent dephospho-CoA kinase family protein [Nitrosarchaeum sp.]|nr:GTP-dependent dephospho-CoA kinase family protein [Nitrosarchaeum sp.]
MNLPDSLRAQLKIPLGTLVVESQTSKKNIQNYLPKNAYLITVGDRTTEKMIDYGFIPSLQIIDNQEKRITRESPKNDPSYIQLSCNNPAAQITLESIEQIKHAFTLKTPVRLTIFGEEDLLVIPACIFAPENSIVMYGQPNQGLVIIQVTPEIRNKTQKLLDLME